MNTKHIMTGMFATLIALHVAVANAAPAKGTDVQKSKSGEGDGLIKVATCKDGKAYYAPTNEHRGACSGHGGVASWADGSEVKASSKSARYR
jgi:hypothetical protein